ncbi:MAG TPA: hypothetical protein VLG76_00635 [Rhabdochlamydiaceae bacterium]|nr:hypothetical protein [Rhabdochlamydiaceae bacterium]HSX37323.1 hypothetical protein [Chlamydiales bacterium]
MASITNVQVNGEKCPNKGILKTTYLSSKMVKVASVALGVIVAVGMTFVVGALSTFSLPVAIVIGCIGGLVYAVALNKLAVRDDDDEDRTSMKQVKGNGLEARHVNVSGKKKVSFAKSPQFKEFSFDVGEDRTSSEKVKGNGKVLAHNEFCEVHEGEICQSSQSENKTSCISDEEEKQLNELCLEAENRGLEAENRAKASESRTDKRRLPVKKERDLNYYLQLSQAELVKEIPYDPRGRRGKKDFRKIELSEAKNTLSQYEAQKQSLKGDDGGVDPLVSDQYSEHVSLCNMWAATVALKTKENEDSLRATRIENVRQGIAKDVIQDGKEWSKHCENAQESIAEDGIPLTKEWSKHC